MAVLRRLRRRGSAMLPCGWLPASPARRHALPQVSTSCEPRLYHASIEAELVLGLASCTAQGAANSASCAVAVRCGPVNNRSFFSLTSIILPAPGHESAAAAASVRLLERAQEPRTAVVSPGASKCCPRAGRTSPDRGCHIASRSFMLQAGVSCCKQECFLWSMRRRQCRCTARRAAAVPSSWRPFQRRRSCTSGAARQRPLGPRGRGGGCGRRCWRVCQSVPPGGGRRCSECLYSGPVHSPVSQFARYLVSGTICMQEPPVTPTIMTCVSKESGTGP